VIIHVWGKVATIEVAVTQEKERGMAKETLADVFDIFCLISTNLVWRRHVVVMLWWGGRDSDVDAQVFDSGIFDDYYLQEARYC
jgi:hypothetical protein